jgi:iron(III) transport system ATP-binding protein
MSGIAIMQASPPGAPALSSPLKPHIEISGLEIYYGSVPAVRGVSFNVLPGEQLTLLGPSGCGKTTTLRAIAGLEQPTAGEIRIDGRVVYSSEQRINLRAEKRGLSMVFQSYAIWPHMTVFENVAYGLRVRRTDAAELAEKVHQALNMVQMRSFASRRAAQLSGGQQQRVALARAFVFQPSVLLFDEPLSNLDAKLRADMRIELRELQHRLGITSVYVTHDLEEALAMSDRIVVMRDGLIEQTGTPDEIYRLPSNAFVADFVGSANLIRGRHRGDLDAGGLIALETSAGHIVYGMAYGRPVEADAVVSVRTVHLKVSTAPPAVAQNVWRVPIQQTVFQGDFTQVHVGWGGQHLVARCAAMEPLAVGRDVYISVEPRHVVVLGE